MFIVFKQNASWMGYKYHNNDFKNGDKKLFEITYIDKKVLN
jgi:hypothetical protein